MKFAIFLAGCLIFSGCIQQRSADMSASDPDNIKFIGLSEIVLSNGQRMSVFNYQTDLPIDDVKKLTLEADKIWPYFKSQVDSGGFSSAMIKAHAPPKGFIVTSTQSQSFIYLKDEKGNWARARK